MQNRFRDLKRPYKQDPYPAQRRTWLLLGGEQFKTWDKSQESENVKFIPAGNLFTLGLVLR